MAIDAVTTAIINRIKASLENQQGVAADSFVVSLASPDESGSAAADLDLFLYLITPDSELRNAARLHPHPTPDDPPQLFAPAVPVELRFLATTGAKAPSGAPGLARLAGAIRAVEASSPLSVPIAFQEAVWLSLLPLNTDEMARIWGLFPNQNCRSSFAFRASPVWIDPRDPVPASTAVSDDGFHSAPRQGGLA